METFKLQLGRHLLELLRESPHGLTPPTLLALMQERDWLENTKGRGPYQRVLRLLSQFEVQGLIRKLGRRYVLDEKALVQAMDSEADESIRQALEATRLPVDPGTWLEKLKIRFGNPGEVREP